jgi:hypothetical protein
MTFQIQKAVRKGAPALIGLWGPSSSGKTYTALQIARGLVGPQGRIGLIDTERRRAEFYADLAGGWDHLNLEPPFSPQRYTEALGAFEEAGQHGCVIVDSMSHVWEGEGGVLDVADRSTYGGLKKWQAPKMAYKRMVNNLLRAPFHVIFCLRAKDGVKQTGKGKDAEIDTIGAQPICGKGFIYEMTVSALLAPDHCPAFQGKDELIHCDPLIPALKAPEALYSIFKPGQPLGIEAGIQIAKWLNGAANFDAGLARMEREARNLASLGTERYLETWNKTAPEHKAKLAHIHEELLSLAAEADREAEHNSGGEYDGMTESLPL